MLHICAEKKEKINFMDLSLTMAIKFNRVLTINICFVSNFLFLDMSQFYTVEPQLYQEKKISQFK